MTLIVCLCLDGARISNYILNFFRTQYSKGCLKSQEDVEKVCQFDYIEQNPPQNMITVAGKMCSVYVVINNNYTPIHT